MSLINDALKRARHVQVRQPSGADFEPPLEPAVPRSGASPWFRRLAPFAAGALLLLACWCLALWWRQSPEPARATAGLNPAADEIVAAVGTLSNQVISLAGPPPSASGFQPPAVSRGTMAAPAARSSPPTAPVTAAVTVPQPARRAAHDLLEASRPPASPPENQHTQRLNPPDQPDTIAPVLKLQGIFYRMSNASALINDQTLFVGDEVEGAKLVAIERHGVRVVVGGQTNVLTLR